MQSNITGSRNIAIGESALSANVTGSGNIAHGAQALQNSDSDNNTAIGYLAGSSITTGSNNVVIGYNAQASAVSVSNEITFGDANVANFRIPGIGLDATDNRFKTTGHYAGSAPVTITADHTVADSDYWIINNKSGSTCVLTLPAPASWTGRILNVKTIQAQTVVSASSNVKPIDTDTAGTAILAATAGNWATLVSDGTDWVIMAQS
jgi:hypothetical protein